MNKNLALFIDEKMITTYEKQETNNLSMKFAFNVDLMTTFKFQPIITLFIAYL